MLIIGGGIAGLTAAHELKDRGFQVTVYEREETFGGKARSFPVPDDVRIKKIRNLPGEHGFRFFPGFYKHLVETLRRIPCAPGTSVYNNLIEVEHAAFAQEGRVFFRFPTKQPKAVKHWLDAFRTMFENPSLGVRPHEAAFAALKLLSAMTMCDERREAELDGVSWWTYMRGDDMSEAYRRAVIDGLTQNFVAMDAKESSTKSVINILARLLNDFTAGPTMDRILNGPTSETWIDPWLKYLRAQDGRGSVKLENRHVHSFEYDPQKGMITGVYLKEGSAPEERIVKAPLSADFYIAALPVEAMTKVLERTVRTTPDILENCPPLKLIGKLKVNWMSGIMYYLKTDARMCPGHIVYLNSGWALTSISQNQFWKKQVDRYGSGACKGVVSVIISDWFSARSKQSPLAADRAETPGVVADQTLEQIRAHIAAIPEIDLSKDNVVGYFLDPAIVFQKSLKGLMSAQDFLTNAKEWSPDKTPVFEKKLKEKPKATVDLWNRAIKQNKEPLFINTVGSWSHRPTVNTGISNLFLASDYVKTNTDLATMEGANEAARRAVNAILDALQSKQRRCKIFTFQEHPLLAPFRALDKQLFDLGLPRSILR